jgi:hypothetical protein
MNPNQQTADKTGPNKSGKTARFALFSAVLIIVLGGGAFFLARPKASAVKPVVNIVTQPVPMPETTVTEKVADKPVKKTTTKKTTVKARAIQPKEAFNPAKYLTSSIKTRKNVVGQAVIGGYITNISSSMVFKDIVLDVSYLSKTGAIITTQRFVVYEIIQPGKKANFKFKTKQPTGTKTYSVELTNAVLVK